MANIGTLFNVIALAYLFIAVRVALQLRQHWHALWDDELTAADQHLIQRASFFIAVPPAVALHELGHALATWAFGGRIIGGHYMFYWGYVIPERDPAFTPVEMAAIALAGNLVSLMLGYGAVALGWFRQQNGARGLALFSFGKMMLVLSLAVYPIMSLVSGFGDFAILRRSLNELQSHGGDIACAVYLGIGAVTQLVSRTRAWQSGVRLRATPLRDEFAAAGRKLAENPGDVEARLRLARTRLAAGQLEEAVAAYESLTATDATHAQAFFGLGIAELSRKQAARAIAPLERALALVEAKHDAAAPNTLEVQFMLGEAYLMAEKFRDAVRLFEHIRQEHPELTRATLNLARALSGMHDGERALHLLEQSLESARTDVERYHLREQLEQLRRRSRAT